MRRYPHLLFLSGCALICLLAGGGLLYRELEVLRTPPAPVSCVKQAASVIKTDSILPQHLDTSASVAGENVPVPAITDAPCLALVIDDFGYSIAIAEQIYNLHLSGTVWAIIPDAPRAEEIARFAEKHGQPYILHIPMQAVSDSVGSADYLIGTDTSADRIEELLADFNRRFPAFQGANNHRGSKATSDVKLMHRFMKRYSKYKKGFIDSRTIAGSVARKVAEEYHIPVVENNVFIDGTGDLPTMKKRFATALLIARRRGKAVAICHARKATLPFMEYVSNTDFSPVRFVSAGDLWRKQQSGKKIKED